MTPAQRTAKQTPEPVEVEMDVEFVQVEGEVIDGDFDTAATTDEPFVAGLYGTNENGMVSHPIPGVQYSSIHAPVIFGNAQATYDAIDDAISAAIYLHAQAIVAFKQEDAPTPAQGQQAPRANQQQQPPPAPAQGGQRAPQQGGPVPQQAQGEGGREGHPEEIKNPPAQDIVTNEGAVCPGCGYYLTESKPQYQIYQYESDNMAHPQIFYCARAPSECTTKTVYRSKVERWEPQDETTSQQ